MRPPPLLLLLVALLFLFSPASAFLNVTFTDGALATAANASLAPLVVAIHTQDYFQDTAPPDPYTRAGYPAYLPFVRHAAEDGSETCSFEVEPPNPEMVASRAAYARYNETIMVVEWPRAAQCLGLITLSQLWPLAEAYNASLPAAGLPPSRTLVVLLANQYDGVQGNPVYEPYLSRSIGVSDAPPPLGLAVQLVVSDEFRKLYEAEQARRLPRNTVTYTVVREPGPWQEMFSAPDLRAAVLMIFAIDLGVLVMAVGQLALVVWRREFSFDIRNVIFLMGLLGSALYTATLLMRIQTYATRVVEMASSYVNTLAFHILLWLWSVFVMHIHRNRSIYYLRGVIIFGLVTMTFSTVFSAVMLNYPPSTPALVTMSLVVGYWVPITQLVLACMFLVYAAKFRARRHGMQISKATNDALNRLQWLAAIAFLAYTALAFTNLRPITQLMTTPRALAAIVLLRMCAASIRGIAIISVMGVRSPSRNSPSQNVTTFHATSTDNHTRFLPTASTNQAYYGRKGSAMPLKTPMPNYGDSSRIDPFEYGAADEKPGRASYVGLSSFAYPEHRPPRADDADSSVVESYTAGSTIADDEEDVGYGAHRV